jgi:paraquat-inducible protein B
VTPKEEVEEIYKKSISQLDKSWRDLVEDSLNRRDDRIRELESKLEGAESKVKSLQEQLNYNFINLNKRNRQLLECYELQRIRNQKTEKELAEKNIDLESKLKLAVEVLEEIIKYHKTIGGTLAMASYTANIARQVLERIKGGQE